MSIFYCTRWDQSWENIWVEVGSFQLKSLTLEVDAAKRRADHILKVDALQQLEMEYIYKRERERWHGISKSIPG